jgi:hypothetical protein
MAELQKVIAGSGKNAETADRWIAGGIPLDPSCNSAILQSAIA